MVGEIQTLELLTEIAGDISFKVSVDNLKSILPQNL